METMLSRVVFSKILLLLAGCLAASVGFSQLVIQGQFPPGGMLQKTQLWNLSVLNNYNRPMDVQVQLIMTDPSGSTQRLKALSRTVTLKAGMNLLNFLQVSPVTYVQVGQGFSIGRDPMGFVPVGQYLACYSITAFNGDAAEMLAEECLPVTVEPLSPPVLSLPFDEDSLATAQPHFSWLPPTPIHLFQNLSYDFSLVKLLPGQGSADAIQKNRPVYSISAYNGTQLQYPLSYPSLDTTAWYAWQVAARNGRELVARSEVWTFTFSRKQDLSPPAGGYYYHELKTKPDGSFAVCGDQIRFIYRNESNDSLISLSLSDISKEKKENIGLAEEELAVKFGNNYLEIDTRMLGRMKPGHFYILQVSNRQQEMQYLKFRYQSPK